MQHLTAPELAALIAAPDGAAPFLLDVREPWEVQTLSLIHI